MAACVRSETETRPLPDTVDLDESSDETPAQAAPRDAWELKTEDSILQGVPFS